MAQTTDSMSSLVPIVALGVSFVSGLLVAYFSGWVAKKNRQVEKATDNLQTQLNEFYGPLRALLAENTQVYEEFGPGRFQGRAATTANSRGATWNSLKETVLVPNLKSIRILIQNNWIRSDIAEKRHLRDLMLHCVAFCEYDKAPNEMYQKFKYKKEWVESIDRDIALLKEKIGE
jgi:hypothetical protein